MAQSVKYTVFVRCGVDWCASHGTTIDAISASSTITASDSSSYLQRE